MDHDAICCHCRHWDALHAVKLPIYKDGRLECHSEFAACTRNAVEADAGECLPMMGAYGHCQWHAEAFEPHADYLYARHEAEHANDGLPIMQLDPSASRPCAHVA